MRLRVCLALLGAAIVWAMQPGLRAQADATPVPTAIEQALTEHACSETLATALDSTKHDECLHAKLAALRADFGRDLGRLSVGERRTIDSTCAQLRGGQGRDAYLDCLNGQLTTILNRRKRSSNAAAAPAAEAAAAPVAEATSNAEPTVPSRAWIAVAAGTVILVAAAVIVVLRQRRRTRVCHVCGTPVKTPGDMCAACRHEAAEALRRAAAERDHKQRLQDDQARLQREREEEDRQRVIRDAEAARLREQDAARQRDEEGQRQAEEARRRDAEAAERREATTAPTSAAFDPYQTLGVTADASADAIQAAYQEAKVKYDLEQVADLGLEVREHYLAKAQAVERAFEMIGAAPQTR